MTNKNQIKNHKNNSGFMALLSAIIISVILLLIATSLSSNSFYGRFNILDRELKERSSALADACVDSAILKLANNPSYTPITGGETVSVGEDDCIIQSITSGSNEKTINIRADYNNYVTNLKIIIDSSDLHVISFEEI